MENPKLVGLRIFPFKSLPPLEIQASRVLPEGGLENDRRYAFMRTDGSIVSAKQEPRLHQLRLEANAELTWFQFSAAGSSAPIEVRPAEGFANLEAWLRQLWGFPIRVVEDQTCGFPDDRHAPGPTLISQATIETAASWFPQLDENELRSRLRTNLEITNVPAFWEDRLVPKQDTDPIRFRIGSAEFLGINPCQRCAVPSRDSGTGEVTPAFASTFARQRKKHLPSWSPRERFDHYYRVAVNTRVAPDSQRPTKPTIIRLNDSLELEDGSLR